MNPVEIATGAARIGAEVLTRHWQQLGKEDADLKGRNDWVSKADRESEEAIVRYLREASPEASFLGEEAGARAATEETGSGLTWIIDPLDGTSNYLQHFPFWCISIGLKKDREMVAAVIYEPLRGELFTAEKGAGAFRNGEPMQVSDQGSLEGAFIATGFPFRAQKFVGIYTDIFRDVISTVKGVRRAGSAALDLAYTAAGVFDGFFELHLAPWDIAAGGLLVREAGGVVTDFSGGESFWERGNILGAPAGVHAPLLSMINRYTREEQLDR
ncbi:MAG: inositol monophosphatase family protein [Thermoanaerobaculia bacterium]